MVRRRIFWRGVKKNRPIWQRRAHELGELLRVDSLEQTAIAEIASRAANERIAIACSGGADSVALVLVLWACFPARRGRWLILHFNHKLRGRASGLDARFVATLARNLREKCVVGSWDRAGAAGRNVSEAEARAARHAFFEHEMKKSRSVAIALGHQHDDIVETMLMRLTRGSGAGGLAAPRPVQWVGRGQVRVRPLLTVGRGVLRGALRQVGATWREDASNQTNDYFRNRVRQTVVPKLEAASPQDVCAGFAASRARLQEDDEALENFVTERVGHPEPGRRFELGALVSGPPALLRRAIQRWLTVEDLSGHLSRAGVNAIFEAVVRSEDRRISAGTNRFVRTKDCSLRVEEGAGCVDPVHIWRPVRLTVGESVMGPSGDSLSAKEVQLTPRLRRRILRGEWSPAEVVFVDPGANWSGSFLVRSWEKGDRYRPLGAPGRSTLQNLFVNRKIPKEQRKCLPVICKDESSPLWVPGLPPAQDVSLQLASNLVVQLTYARPLAKLNRLTPQPSRNA